MIDEWIICVDKSRKLYVFVGAGMNDYRGFISKDEIIGGSGRQAYMLTPTTSLKYKKLKSPSG